MSPSHPGGCCGVTRRGFLLGAAAGLAAGVPLSWLALRGVDHLRQRTPLRVSPPPRTDYAMPGPYPGRVVEVRHPYAVAPDHRINAQAVDTMIDRGMTELTGADHPREAWRRFFDVNDVVGIKVNPVGRKPSEQQVRREGRNPNSVGVISSPEVLLKIVRELKEAGVKARNIIVFERYADEFVAAGYDQVMNERDMEDVRWLASSAGYSNTQLDIAGFDRGRDAWAPELARHVAGYDPDVFVHMGFASPNHDAKDDRRFRSHLSVIVTRLVNKLITIPNLKDHRSAGVTLALKNMSHGLNNNVARSHISGIERLDGSVSGPNQCNTFIPTACSHHLLRQKATLHIMDGLIGVYEGGPGSWNKTWGTWRHQGLFFATDPVAMDHVGWNIIDAERSKHGLRSVAETGLLEESAEDQVARALAPLAPGEPLGAVSLAYAAKNRSDGRNSETFDLRTPQHVILAGEHHGLGIFDRRGIEHRCVTL